MRTKDNIFSQYLLKYSLKWNKNSHQNTHRCMLQSVFELFFFNDDHAPRHMKLNIYSLHSLILNGEAK